MTSEEDNEALDFEEPDDLILEDFQKELAEPCCQGENRIILAPTNSGKTYVAMAIVKVNL